MHNYASTLAFLEFLFSSKLPHFLKELERVKWDLSEVEAAYIDMNAIIPHSPEKEVMITRSAFEDSIHSLIEETVQVCKNCLAKAQHTLSAKDGILMVGGSSHMALVESTLKQTFPEVPIFHTTNPQTASAEGAWLEGGRRKAEKKGKPFQLSKGSACLKNEYSIAYSFDSSSQTVIIGRGLRYSQTVRVAIDVPKGSSLMHLWEEKENPKRMDWFGDVDLKTYEGKKVGLVLSFDEFGELHVMDSLTNTPLLIEYSCRMREDEKDQFVRITRMMELADKGLNIVTHCKRINEKSLNYFNQVKGIGNNLLLNNWNSELSQYCHTVHDQMFDYIKPYI